MGKSGFFIDFQKFLKIDLEIIRTEEQMKPVPLIFDETSGKKNVARTTRSKVDFSQIFENVLPQFANFAPSARNLLSDVWRDPSPVKSPGSE